MTEDIRVGDVVLDLAQGRPMQVVEVHSADAGVWSVANGYDLSGNYANDRLGATDDDAVYECVYVSNLRSEPSKTYAFPEARLARIEVEAATKDGDRVQDALVTELLAEMFDAAREWGGQGMADEVWQVAVDADVDHDVLRVAEELADAQGGDSA